MKEALRYTQVNKKRRARRVRAKLHGTRERPRLLVHLSLKHLYGQLIDDDIHKTLLNISDAVLGKKMQHVTTEMASELGKKIAEAAKAQGIEAVIFDRGERRYHGRVKAFAEGAREGGLQF